MASTATAEQLLTQLKGLVPFGTAAVGALQEAQIKQAQDTLRNLKLELLKFPSVAPASSQILTLHRDTLESACFLSLYAKDVKAFERYLAQVKVYYNDFQSLLPTSAQQGPILGLYLLCLLSQNQIAEFHTEYELLCHSASTASGVLRRRGSGAPASPSSSSFVASNPLLSSPFIRFPVQLEAQLMEGCYNQILTAKAAVPLPIYAIFMDSLAETGRSKIADCSELAYAALPVAEIQKLLMLQSTEEVNKFIATRKAWTVANGVCSFNRAVDAKVEIPALKIIKQTLDYATELERIV